MMIETPETRIPTCNAGFPEMELGGFEPPTSWVRSRRSAS
jgi:hypothetical protein